MGAYFRPVRLDSYSVHFLKIKAARFLTSYYEGGSAFKGIGMQYNNDVHMQSNTV
jgi:hypothetical protein